MTLSLSKLSQTLSLSMSIVLFCLCIPCVLSGNLNKFLWFSCVGGEDTAFTSQYFQFLKVALASASKNAPSLFPVVLYSGPPGIAPTWLLNLHTARQLALYNHNLSFSSEIAKFKPALSRHGAFLRLDIPYVVCSGRFISMMSWLPFHTDHVLYTDTDVIFLKDIPWHNMTLPGVISIGPEDVKGSKLNSGILIMNIPVLIKLLPGFLNFANYVKWDRGAVDQGLILEYFNWQAILLDDHMNWKAYWGPNPSAVILHYHGPKPLGRCGDCISVAHNHSETGECDELKVALFFHNCQCPNYFAVLKHTKVKYNYSYCFQSNSFFYYNSIFKYYITS